MCGNGGGEEHAGKTEEMRKAKYERRDDVEGDCGDMESIFCGRISAIDGRQVKDASGELMKKIVVCGMTTNV